MRIINSLFVLLFASSLFAQKGEDIVAKVNGEPILLSDYNKTKEILIEQYSNLSPEFMQQKDAMSQIEKMAMDKMIDELLLKQKAEAMKIKVYERQIDEGVAEVKKRFSRDKNGAILSSKDAEDAFNDELKRQNMTMSEFRAKIKRDLMARKLIEETIRPKIKNPSEDEIKSYFNKIDYIIKGDTANLKISEEEFKDLSNVANKFKELISERLRLRHILIKPDSNDLVSKNKALEEANKIKKELDNGKDFEELALKYSDDKASAVRGGDIGYVIKGMLPEEIEEKAFKMCPGQIEGPIETKFGYHIIRVDEKRIAQKFNLEDAKEDIAQLIMQENFAKEIENFTKELRQSAKIEEFRKVGN